MQPIISVAAAAAAAAASSSGPADRVVSAVSLSGMVSANMFVLACDDLNLGLAGLYFINNLSLLITSRLY